MAKSIINVEGMNCNNCVDMIRSTLSALDGVDDVKIDFENKVVNVEHDNVIISQKQLEDNIIEIGYRVRG